jgi:GNAT superfamily N-acetyltransferase
LLAIDRATDLDRALGHACWSVAADGAADVGVLVLDEVQRRGIGGLLLRAATAAAARAGAGALTLDVHPANRQVVTALRRSLAGVRPELRDGLLTWRVPIAQVLPGWPDDGQ